MAVENTVVIGDFPCEPHFQWISIAAAFDYRRVHTMNTYQVQPTDFKKLMISDDI